MKAIRIHFADKGNDLRMEEVPQPDPKADEVMIRTQAIGVNRADLGRRRTVSEGAQEPPRIPGLDVAGVVASVGANVSNWHPGDHVMALVRGAYAAYAVAPSVLTFRPPVGMPTTDAASLPCVFFTAWYAFQMAELKRGETALIHAAGSGVGMAGIQIAKALGARVLTSAGSDARVERGRQLGAEAGVNYSTEHVTEALLRLTDGRGVDMVLDTVGGAIFDATLRALAQGGRVVTVGGHTGQRPQYEDPDLAKKEQWVRPMGVFNEAQRDVDQRGWAQMKSWFETGMLRTVVQEVFPWTEAKRVQELLASRGVFGKLVMEVR
ncbi:MAG: quinone oxidoreductase family protein [Candidatus Entotheonellia bacterium]